VIFTRGPIPLGDKPHYWECEVEKIFDNDATVEVLFDGKKKSSQYLGHGVQCSPPSVAIIQAGGQRIDYYPHGKYTGTTRPTAIKNTKA